MTNTPKDLNTIESILAKFANAVRKAEVGSNIKNNAQIYSEAETQAVQALNHLLIQAKIDGANDLWDSIRTAPKDSWYGTATEYLEQIEELKNE